VHQSADAALRTEHQDRERDLNDAVHIGHSTGGGEVSRYVTRHQDRVVKAVLVASLTPSMVKTDDNPAGQPKEWFDAVQAGVLGNRAEFFRAVPEGPFYGYGRAGAMPSEAVIANWWRQGSPQRPGPL
jgi:non-heme chloroperoxidase